MYTAGGNVAAQVEPGAAITGFGLSPESTQTLANVSLNNQGSITNSAGVPGPAGGTAVAGVTAAGGNVSYTGNGSVVAPLAFSTNALVLTTVGSGVASVGSAGSPISGGTFAGTNAIVTSTVSGNAGVYLSGGTVTATGTNSDAIHGSNTTGGDFTVTLTGGTSIVNGSGGVNNTFGIGVADSAGGVTNSFGPGNVNITSNANFGVSGPVFATGISIGVPGSGGITGNASVDLNGGTIHYQNDGVNVLTAGSVATGGNGNINVLLETNGTLAETGSEGTGINAVASGATGAVTVTVNGTIDPPDVGVNAAITNAANSSAVNVPVGASASITANDVGILASTAGTGSVTVTTAAGSVVNQGVGGGVVNGNITPPLGAIVTSATSGTTTIDAEGAVTANNFGINATSTNGGAIGITTGASAIRGDANSTGIGSGIYAADTGGSGNISITTGTGTVTGNNHNGIGYGGAVEAHALGTGTITVGIGSGGVQVDDASPTSAYLSDGILTSAATGATQITTNGVVDASFHGGDGIAANSQGGSIQVTTNANVLGALTGIDTINTTGSTNITTAAGTLVASALDDVVANGTGDGITAFSTTGGITGNINSAVTSSAPSGIGIYFVSEGGNLNLTTGGGAITGATGVDLNETGGGTVTFTGGSGTITGANGAAISTAATTGLTSITTNGLVTATGGDGVNAASTTGGINIQANANVTSTTADGIVAFASGAGPITVQTAAAAAVSGLNNGISANSGGGAVTVTTLGTVAGTNNTGIIATSTLAGGAQNVEVTASNTVSGGTNGIVAQAVGVGNTGTVTVQTAQTVTGTANTGIISTTVNGANTVTADNTVTGGINGISASSSLGPITVNGTGAVVGTANTGIVASSSGGNVSVAQTNTVSGGINGISASTTLAGTVYVDATNNVTGGTAGAGGNGIVTSAVNGNTEIDVNNANTTVRGVGSGFGAIYATSADAGNILINVNPGTLVVNNTAGTTGHAGPAVVIDTSNGTGGATLNNDSVINGYGGTVNYATIRIANNNSGAKTVTINNFGVIRENVDSGAGWAIATTRDPFAAANPSPNTQAVVVNNNNTINGRVWLGSGADTFNNNGGGVWNVSGGDTTSRTGPANQLGNGSTIANFNFINIGATTPFTADQNSFTGFVFSNNTLGTLVGTNTITNNGTINSWGNVNFQFVGANSATDITNSGLFRVGSNSGSNESTSFSSDGQQFVTNFNSEFRVVGSGTGTPSIGSSALAALGPSGVGALNFTGADGSSFSNEGGIVNMLPTGNTYTAVTFNTTALTGSTEGTYLYTFGSGNYNFFGGQSLAGDDSRLAVNTQLGGVGSTSDRLVIGGNIYGVTDLVVNNTNSGPGAINLHGITVAAVEGTGSDNIVVAPSSVIVNGVANANYVNFGPLGAIANGAFVDPLIYVPGGATTTSGPNANAYKFFGLPGPFLTELPIAFNAAQNIWGETALGWEDRQTELRNYFQCGMTAAGEAYGGGADLPTRKGPPPAPVGCYAAPTVWIKGIGSGTWANVNENLGSALGNGLLSGLSYDESYRQTTFGFVGGIDWGKSQVFSPTDSFVIGVMGGYVNSNLTFDQSNTLIGPSTTTQFTYSGGTVGVSGDYMNGGFFVDALVMANFLNLDIGGIPGGYTGTGGSGSQNVNSTTWGVLGNVGYRWEVGRYFIEPLATFQWTDTNIGDLNLPGAGVNASFSNGDAFQIAGGFRVGGILMDDRFHYLEGSFVGKVWGRVSGDNDVNFTSGLLGSGSNPSLGNQFTLNNKYNFNNDNIYGEVGFQLDWFNRGPGWSAFANADAKFNSQFATVTGKVGVTYGF